jgi:protein tyrosine phosphatase (PTP) superfamily phosphohydrolase (DUF442 family)
MLDDVLNFLPVLPGVGTAGQPTAEQFHAIRRAGYELVVNLAMSNSSNALLDEAGLVAAEGMDYVHIPVVWENPTLSDLARFFQVMEENRSRRVFVHCALNFRVSTFTYLYRVIRLGTPQEEAMWDMLSIWEPEPRWEAFIAEALQHYVPGG